MTNNHGYLKYGEEAKGILYLDVDYMPVGTSSFDVVVNSNAKENSKSKTYRIVVHKGYDSFEQFTDLWEDEPVPVMTKPVVLTRYTYTGREYNREVDQYYYRARTYVSGLGRFTGKDPVGCPGYEYGENNSIIYSDYTGKKSIRNLVKQIWNNKITLVTLSIFGIKGVGMAITSYKVYNKYKGDTGNNNCIRHCTWSCLLTQQHGVKNARTLEIAHEMDSKNPDDSRIDEHWNKIGCTIGNIENMMCEDACNTLVNYYGCGSEDNKDEK